MPRHPRIHAKGLLYHVIARGNNGQKIVLTHQDNQRFLNNLRELKAKYNFRLYAYAIMPNHFHLLIEVGDEPIWKIMQALLTRHSRYFNTVYKRRGHLFQGRYRSIICEKDNYLLELVRYIHLNPVRAGLVKRAESWVWSGHGEYLGRKKDIIDQAFLLGILGGKNPRNTYMKFLNAGRGIKYIEEYHPKDIRPFLGSGEFVKDTEEIRKSESKTVKKSGDLKDIANEICGKFGIEFSILTSKSRVKDIVKYKIEFIKSAIECGFACSEIARFLEMNASTVSRVVNKVMHVMQA